MYLEPDWRDDDFAESQSPRPRRRALWLVLALIGLGGVALLIRSAWHDSAAPQRPHPPMIETITLPPPPPPPKPQVKPPEPPKPAEAKPTQMPPPEARPQAAKPSAPKPAANAKPAGAPLTAAPGSGANPYGLQAGNGSGDTIGGGNGDGGSEGGGYGFYALKVQSQLQAALTQDDKTRHGSYVVVAQLWLNSTGHVERVEITRSSGDPDRDAALASLLKRQTISEAPPAGMPQPITTRIAARG